MLKNANVVFMTAYSDFETTLAKAINCAGNNQQNQVVLLVNVTGQQTIDDFPGTLELRMPDNLRLRVHPSNRLIEPHLLLLHFMTRCDAKKIVWLHESVDLSTVALGDETSAIHTVSEANQTLGFSIDKDEIMRRYQEDINFVNELKSTLH